MSEVPVNFPGSTEVWNGYRLYRFQLGACACTAVVPSSPRPGRQWFWRAKFFNAFPNFDLAMVRKGFYLLHIDVSGCADLGQAIAAMDHFHAFLTGEYGMASKVLMEAYSTGAINAMEWANRHPGNTAGICLDNPVLEERYWLVSAEHGTGETDDAAEDSGFCAEHFRPLAEERVPVRIVYNRDDAFCHTCQKIPSFIRAYQNMGGKITVEECQGDSHGPHCLDNSESALQFAEECFQSAPEA